MRAQQEIAGFVLIVLIVVVGLMVFLVVSLKNPIRSIKSMEVENILKALMKQTSRCAIVFEPDYDNFEKLFKDCYQGRKCSNLKKSACDYLNESLDEIMGIILKTEAPINAYQLDFFEKKNNQGILRLADGNCSGRTYSAQRSVISGSDSLIIRLKICKD